MKNVSNSDSVLIFIGVFFLLYCELCIFGSYFIPSFINQKKENIINNSEIVYLKSISVKEMLNEYQEKLESSSLVNINMEYLTLRDDTYYVGIYQDIILFVTPINLKNIENDVVYQLGIIIDKDSSNYELAKNYYRYLIEVNNEFIYNVEDLVNETLNNDGEIVDQNNGLKLVNIDSEYEINFVIERKISSN